MLIGYFDESGTHDGSPCAAVAGFISTQERWEGFEREWSALLKVEGVTQYRASEIAHGVAEFSGWGNERKAAFQSKVVDVIKRYAIHGVSCTLINSEYDQIVRADRDPEMPKKAGVPYSLLVGSCVRLTAEWTRKNYKNESVAFIFEDAPSTGEVSAWASRQKKITKEIKSLTFAGKDVLPLQAADFHAYEALKHTNNWWLARAKTRPARKSLESLIRGMESCNGFIWDKPALRKLVKDVRNATEY